MPKYIEVEELDRLVQAEIDRCLEEISTEDDDTQDRFVFTILGAYRAVNIAKHMPSADVVDVVRCKDCKNSVCIGEYYFCNIQYDEWGQPYEVEPDGYCDAGERKEANESETRSSH